MEEIDCFWHKKQKPKKKLVTLLQQQITTTPGELNGQRDNENCYIPNVIVESPFIAAVINSIVWPQFWSTVLM